MADGKKVDPYEVFYYIYLFAAVIGLAVVCYMKLNSVYLYLMGSILGCYTVGFCGGAILMAIRIITRLNRSKWKFDLRISLLTAAAALTLICGVNCLAKDVSRSKTLDVLSLVEKTEETSSLQIYLSEYTEKTKIGETEYETVKLDVYQTGGRFAKHLGTIDETYFANRCAEMDTYSYTYGEDGIFTLNLSYGAYGDGAVMLNPAADSGVMTYTFKVK